MYTFTINGVKRSLKDGFVIKEELNEKMDSAIIVCNTTDQLDIVPFDDVTIEGDGISTKHFKVDNFIENIVRFTPDKDYEYTINLFSETKYLERITLPSLSITKINGVKRSVSFYIKRILKQYLPQIKVSTGGNNWLYKPQFNVSDDLIAKFNRVECPEFSWNDPTLKEVLDDLLMVDDCIVLVKDHLITYYDLKRKGVAIHTEYLTNGQRTMASADYLSDLTITMKNAIGKNLNVTTEYQSVRSEGGEVTTENMMLFTNHPIYKIKSVKACAIQTFEIIDDNNETTIYKKAYTEVDITPLIKEQDEFNVLNPSDIPSFSGLEEASQYKKYCLYYKRGDNKIQNLGSVTFFKSTLQNAINVASMGDSAIRNRFSDLGTLLTITLTSDQRNVMFKIEYETLAERKLKVGKYLPTKNPTNEVFDNQTSSYVDVQQQSIFEYAKANRLGNLITIIYGEYETENDVPQLGDYIGDDILFSREISCYDGYIQFKGTLTKNYILKNYFTGIKSKHRSWQIAKGSEALTRYDITKLYGEFSFHPKYDKIPFLLGLNGQIDYNQDFFKHLLAPISPMVVEGVKHAVIFTKSGKDVFPSGASGYELELNSEVQGRSICFNIGYNDNYSVGNYVEMDGSIYRNGIYKYADGNGEFDYMGILFLNSIDKSDDTFIFPSNLQEIPPTFVNSYNQKFAEIGRTKPKITFTENDLANVELSLNLKDYFKDNREIIKHTLQIEFCSDDEDIVVADYFVKSQRVIRDIQTIEPLKIYTIPITALGTRYKVGDTHALGEDHTSDYKLIVSFPSDIDKKVMKISLQYTGSLLRKPFIRGWAIANQWGILLLGVNTIKDRDVYFNILSNRNDNVYDSVENQNIVGKMWEDLTPKN